MNQFSKVLKKTLPRGNDRQSWLEEHLQIPDCGKSSACWTLCGTPAAVLPVNLHMEGKFHGSIVILFFFKTWCEVSCVVFCLRLYSSSWNHIYSTIGGGQQNISPLCVTGMIYVYLFPREPLSPHPPTHHPGCYCSTGSHSPSRAPFKLSSMCGHMFISQWGKVEREVKYGHSMSVCESCKRNFSRYVWSEYWFLTDPHVHIFLQRLWWQRRGYRCWPVRIFIPGHHIFTTCLGFLLLWRSSGVPSGSQTVCFVTRMCVCQ